jgi:Holliday junction resolvasome RuvABC endonuclease subunit
MIIGIDQSLTGTGIASIDDDGTLLMTQTVETSKMRGVERLAQICQVVEEMCDNVGEKYVVAREGYSFGSKGRATFSLGELGGCLDLTLYQIENPNLKSYYIIPPTTIKKLCLGSGAIKKDSAYLLKIFTTLGIEFANDNEADAYMIAVSLWKYLRSSKANSIKGYYETLKVYEKEAILSSLISKSGSGVTKASLKNLTEEDYATAAKSVLDGYLCFAR